MLGEPEGGWPKRFQEIVLRSAHAEPIVGRPGAALPPADFAAAAAEIQAKDRREPREEDVLSYLLYPQVYPRFLRSTSQQYGDTSTIPTAELLLRPAAGRGDLDRDRARQDAVSCKYLTTGEVREDGTRTVFFELNGQPRDSQRRRSVGRGDCSSDIRKADPDNAEPCRAPMPGKVSAVAVRRRPGRQGWRTAAVDRSDEDGDGGLQSRGRQPSSRCSSPPAPSSKPATFWSC